MKRHLKWCIHSCNSTRAGFTLFDLLIALLIASILMATAVPSFNQLRLRSDLQTQGQMVFRLTQSSRAASLDTASSVTLCGTTDFKNCTSSNFRNLMAFVDANNSDQREENEAVLYQYGVSEQLIMHLNTPAHMQQSWLKYRAAQADANPYGSFYLCAAKSGSLLGQRVKVSNVGRNQLAYASPAELKECKGEL